MKDEPKVKAARARIDEYIAERVREEDEKRRRTAEGGRLKPPPVLTRLRSRGKGSVKRMKYQMLTEVTTPTMVMRVLSWG